MPLKWFKMVSQLGYFGFDFREEGEQLLKFYRGAGVNELQCFLDRPFFL